MVSVGREGEGPSQHNRRGPDRSQPGPHLLPRPSRAKSAWQRVSLDLRRKPHHRQCQVRPEDTNICLASALLVQIGHWQWG